MPRIQQIQTYATTKSGRKKYTKHVVTIPKVILNILNWRKGDELSFEIRRRDLVRGIISLRKRRSGKPLLID